MTRAIIQDGDEVREMNDREHTQYLIDVKTAALTAKELAAADTAHAAAKKSAEKKLAALGLTADEIAAL